MESIPSKDFIFNFWLNTENSPQLPKQLNGYLFMPSEKYYIALTFANNIPQIFQINSQSLKVDAQYQLDISECPVINYDFLHKKAFLINNRIYLISSQNPRESAHIYIIDIGCKMIFPIKNVDTKPLEFRINPSVELYNYKLLFFGGLNDQMQLSNTLESFDISTYRWEKINTKGKSPSPRHSHCSCIYQERLIILGGSNAKNIYNSDKQCRDIYILDLKSSVWLQIKTDESYLPKNMNYAYLQPIFTDKNNKQQKFVYITQNPTTNEFQSLIFNPVNYSFQELDVYSQKPEYRLGAAICVNHYNQELIIYGGFTFNKIAHESTTNQIDRLALFSEDNPEVFDKLDILGGKKSKQSMIDLENTNEELYEDTNQDFELTFEELLEMEKQHQQNQEGEDEDDEDEHTEPIQDSSQYQEGYPEDEEEEEDDDDDIIDPSVLLNNIPPNSNVATGNKKKKNRKKKKRNKSNQQSDQQSQDE